MPGAPARILATTLDVSLLTARVRRVILAVPESYTFRAGQHLSVATGEEGKGARYYSIASDPGARGTVELCVGESEDAPAFAPGRKFWLSPAGGEAAVPAPVSSLVLVGVGTGVAPLRATVLEQMGRAAAPRMTLLVGFRSEEELLYGAEFEALAASGRLDYRPVLSQPSASWRGRSGRVQQHLADLPPADSYFVCGKLAMVDDVRQRLLDAGISPLRVRAEGY